MTFSPNFRIHVFQSSPFETVNHGARAGGKGPGVGLFSKVFFNLDKRRTKEKWLVQTSKENVSEK
jgi:hypothetical protein